MVFRDHSSALCARFTPWRFIHKDLPRSNILKKYMLLAAALVVVSKAGPPEKGGGRGGSPSHSKDLPAGVEWLDTKGAQKPLPGADSSSPATRTLQERRRPRTGTHFTNHNAMTNATTHTRRSASRRRPPLHVATAKKSRRGYCCCSRNSTLFWIGAAVCAAPTAYAIFLWNKTLQAVKSLKQYLTFLTADNIQLAKNARNMANHKSLAATAPAKRDLVQKATADNALSEELLLEMQGSQNSVILKNAEFELHGDVKDLAGWPAVRSDLEEMGVTFDDDTNTLEGRMSIPAVRKTLKKFLSEAYGQHGSDYNAEEVEDVYDTYVTEKMIGRSLDEQIDYLNQLSEESEAAESEAAEILKTLWSDAKNEILGSGASDIQAIDDHETKETLIRTFIGNTIEKARDLHLSEDEIIELQFSDDIKSLGDAAYTKIMKEKLEELKLQNEEWTMERLEGLSDLSLLQRPEAEMNLNNLGSVLWIYAALWICGLFMLLCVLGFFWCDCYGKTGKRCCWG